MTGDVKFKGSLGCSDQEMAEYRIPGEMEKASFTTVDFKRPDFGLFEDLLGSLMT